jgi:hypothetical protein
LQPHRYFDFRFSIKRLYLYKVRVLELDTALVACDKAWELNKKAGRLALAAKGDSSGER